MISELKPICWNCEQPVRCWAQDGYEPPDDHCDLSKLNCICVNPNCMVNGRLQDFLQPIEKVEVKITLEF